MEMPRLVIGLTTEQEGEADALLRAAFPGPEEAGLVQNLRRAGVLVGEYGLEWQGRIAAYAAVSWLVAPKGWACLAPVAVRPEWQGGALWDGDARAGDRDRWRLGTRLVRALVEGLAARRGQPGIPETLVVLGEPAFYERCGFSLARAARLVTSYPLSHMMIARPGDDVPGEELVYPAAFDGV